MPANQPSCCWPYRRYRYLFPVTIILIQCHFATPYGVSTSTQVNPCWLTAVRYYALKYSEKNCNKITATLVRGKWGKFSASSHGWRIRGCALIVCGVMWQNTKHDINGSEIISVWHIYTNISHYKRRLCKRAILDGKITLHNKNPLYSMSEYGYPHMYLAKNFIA